MEQFKLRAEGRMCGMGRAKETELVARGIAQESERKTEKGLISITYERKREREKHKTELQFTN